MNCCCGWALELEGATSEVNAASYSYGFIFITHFNARCVQVCASVLESSLDVQMRTGVCQLWFHIHHTLQCIELVCEQN